MGEKAAIGIAVIYSVPFVGSAIVLIGLVVFTAITGQPVFVLEH